jgi:predicted transcriptional regulator
MPDEQDPQDLAARQAEMAAALEETERRQDEIKRRQDALLEQLHRLDRAMDRDAEK